MIEAPESKLLGSEAPAKEKYVVFKAEDYERIMDAVNSDKDLTTLLHDLMENELDNFVVIRLHDIFAPTALYEYANAIQTQLELMQAMNVNAALSEEEIGDFDDVMDRLVNIRDYFFAQANRARMCVRKVPD